MDRLSTNARAAVRAHARSAAGDHHHQNLALIYALFLQGASSRLTIWQRATSEYTAAMSSRNDQAGPGYGAGWAIREREIPLPTPESGYARVLLVGATGAGKTTLLRQLLGTHPRTERFPSTSTAKTTIFNTEFIVAHGTPYRAAVSFMPHGELFEHLYEIVQETFARYVERRPERQILRAFMEHPEQRFRLNYILGNPAAADDDEPDDDASPDGDDGESEAPVPEVLTTYFRRLEGLHTELAGDVRAAGVPEAIDDAQQVYDALHSRVRTEPTVREFVEDLIDEICRRVEAVEDGNLSLDAKDWPECWTFETNDRARFIAVVSRFTSNHYRQFGKVVTPVVSGVRVSGPFVPAWAADRAAYRYVLIDGEGLGHTPRSASSVATSLTLQMSDADVVILADNAAQPVQAAALSVVRNLVNTGNITKLMVAFTHFDQVTGPNIPSVQDRKDHVWASLTNGLHSLAGDGVADASIRRIEDHLKDRVAYLSRLHEVSLSALTRQELDALAAMMATALEARRALATSGTNGPRLDAAEVMGGVRAAVAWYLGRWATLLKHRDPFLARHIGGGVERFGDAGVGQHWTRIKALCRRLESGLDQYAELRPVADWHRAVLEGIGQVIDAAVARTPGFTGDPAVTRQVDALKDAISRALIARGTRVMVLNAQEDWARAYSVSGKGSSSDRAGLGWEVLTRDNVNRANVLDPLSNTPFEQAIPKILATAARELGGSLDARR